MIVVFAKCEHPTECSWKLCSNLGRIEKPADDGREGAIRSTSAYSEAKWGCTKEKSATWWASPYINVNDPMACISHNTDKFNSTL